MTGLWIVDVEASGLSPNSYPIEVGFFDGRKEYQALVVPDGTWHHWSQKSEAMHDISRKTLIDQGKEAKVIAEELNTLLGKDIVYTDHEDWDGFWLHRLFEAADQEPSFAIADLYGLLRDGTAEIYAETLDQLREKTTYRAHRALDDAKLIHAAVTHTLAYS